MPKYFFDLKNCLGGGVCGRMPKHFRDLEKMLVRGGGYAADAQIFYRLEKCWGGGVCQQIYGLEKCWGVMLKYFRDLKKNVGGRGS